MGQVVDLERQRVEALARDLVPLLQERGTVVMSVAELGDVQRWRRAARRAGRLLGWHMRTGVSDDEAVVGAASNDRPVSDAERRAAAGHSAS
ncbi:MAG: hypothetical protein KY447_05220 [Actinobacteria bacterium]|nr:hypothetical protein [Actinomycetota bacterium]